MIFQFDEQQYQEDCINNIINIFKQLQENVDFRKVIEDNSFDGNYPAYFSGQKNIDIKMETGTGKTFTFIKTMFELNHNFGYKKFIILVPSIAIREGTKKNLEITKNYFKSYYENSRSFDKEIEVTTYKSADKQAIISFINDLERFSVLIMTPDSFNNSKKIINQPIERDLYIKNIQAKSYLEALKLINPIIIIDEPHKFEGNAFKRYFVGFDNYFLRFGATFPKSGIVKIKKQDQNKILPFSNIAYILDSINSFRQYLVKRITIYNEGTLSKNTAIQEINQKSNIVKVKEFVNGEWQKQDLKIGDKFNDSTISSIKKDNILLANGETHFLERISYILSDEDIRLMIVKTIKLHFNKEKTLFNLGIKALSLFFIRRIDDFKNKEGSIDKPIIKKIFEEEYIKERALQIKDLDGNEEFKNYLEYLKKDFDDANQLIVHKGYFSGDKAKKENAEKESIDEILKDKEKLLSFASSTRFIFSVWALQEGWDNPNIFTICKISNYGSENSKLQQIGRGLRLCVKKEDNLFIRQTIYKFDNQEDFWNINNLDVVVSASEVGFVDAIQKDICENSVTLNQIFNSKELIEILKNKNIKDSNKIVNFMLQNQLISNGLFDDEGRALYKKVPDFLVKINNLKENINNIQNITYQELQIIERLFVENILDYARDGNKIRLKKNLKIKAGSLEIFKELWQKINKKAVFTIKNFDIEKQNKLAKNIANRILQIKLNQRFNQSTKHLQDITNNSFLNESLQDKIITNKYKINYNELISEIASKSGVSLSFAIAIFNNLTLDFKENEINKDILQAKKEIVEIIKQELISSLKTTIEYNFIDGEIFSNIMNDENNNFKNELKAGSIGKNQEEVANFSLKEKWIFEDVIEYDSEFEREIIIKDANQQEITIFAKMPKLEIATPIGKYSPDFCYAIEKEGKKKLFLIIEAKGYENSALIPVRESDKIDFATKYFTKLNAVFNNEINIRFEKRINKQSLADIINQTLKHL
ncbi:MAG: DEAD/DEAH box helicase family protein [Rickettsiales bacterium]|nr:DEAD/DEAH box helicase family protein [Rickettsiales bacterium]